MSVRELPAELKRVAKEELGEDEGKLEEHLEHIRDWLKKQPHIRARTDSQWLATFLRGCKHSLERTKEKLDTFYTVRTHLPELFANRDPNDPKIRDLLEVGTFLPLPSTREPGSPRIILIRGGMYDPAKFTYMDLMRVNYMVMDLLMLEDDSFVVAGEESILDLTGSCIEQVAHFTPSVVKKVVTCFQDAYPVRTKKLFFVNLPASFDVVFNIFKLFMKEKLRNRINVLSDPEKLYDNIPKKVLPSDFGGEGPSIAELTAEWKKKVTEKRDWFIEDAEFGVDESKRPGKPVSGADLFGVEGSFKQLSID